ncbi:Zinc finger, RING/FYVE/PHD-type [Cinara cedri]|uniref:Zinc finger, RING/FYVE/PHD-type n=1 Tax=Cinara cedri TaxID=506608 RepID=A0A5E4MX40_9HEMI|nr:Zinc finger, RING/FYVE/PHD-type [Cinara cedri]
MFTDIYCITTIDKPIKIRTHQAISTGIQFEKNSIHFIKLKNISGMSHQTVKRQIENITYTNDDLNNEEYDVTWGGKKSRYIYNYTALELPDTFSNTDDSDQTESILSIQTKSTAELLSDDDLSSNVSSCGSNCQKCEDSSQSNLTEFDVVSSSPSPSPYGDFIKNFTSDSSSVVDYEVPNKCIILNELSNSSDNGYLPDDTDIQGAIKCTNLPPPACFQTCLQCRKENPNPYFQYCFICFRNRMEFFKNKPNPKRQNKRLSKKSNCKNKLKDAQDSGVFFSQHSDTLTPEENDNSQNGKTISADNVELTQNLCNICLVNPKNGVFNHGKIGHIFSCYQCAKQIRRKSNRCPVCNIKVQFVTKMITV